MVMKRQGNIDAYDRPKPPDGLFPEDAVMITGKYVIKKLLLFSAYVQITGGINYIGFYAKKDLKAGMCAARSFDISSHRRNIQHIDAIESVTRTVIGNAQRLQSHFFCRSGILQYSAFSVTVRRMGMKVKSKSVHTIYTCILNILRLWAAEYAC